MSFLNIRPGLVHLCLSIQLFNMVTLAFLQGTITLILYTMIASKDITFMLFVTGEVVRLLMIVLPSAAVSDSVSQSVNQSVSQSVSRFFLNFNISQR